MSVANELREATGFEVTIGAAIDGARTLAHIDELSRTLWQAHAGGAIGDDEAQRLAERLHERRSAIREGVKPVGIPAGRVSLFPPRRHVASPDKAASRDRRRHLAASGPMPPALASRFTTGQLAVLRIVADEFATKGVCGLCVDAIAARAGVCRRLAQAALRLAEGDGLLVIEERRHQGRKSETNLVRIISREWQAWIRRGRQQRKRETTGCASVGDRVQSDSPHGYKGVQYGENGPTTPSQGLPEAGGRPRREGSAGIHTGGRDGRAMR